MHSRNRNAVAAVAAALTLASGSILACSSSKDPDPKYAKDADTGAAAPATQQTLSPNPQMGDTTQRDRTGAPAMAGDSSGGGRASRDSTTAGQPRTKRP